MSKHSADKEKHAVILNVGRTCAAAAQYVNPVTAPYAASPPEPSHMGRPGFGRRSSMSAADGRAEAASAPDR